MSHRRELSARAATAVVASLALVASLFVPLSATASTPGPFPDVPADAPFASDIQWLVDLGITTGYPDGTFGPTRSISRQAFAAFLFRLDGQTGGGPCLDSVAPFPDVSATATFCAEITWLAGKGITTGYSDGTFRPTALISRQAIAAFLYRYDHSRPGATSADGPCIADAPFSDVAATLTFCEAIHWMASVGPAPITSGYSDATFRPTLPATRQAVAAWFHRYRAYAPKEASTLEFVVAPTTVEAPSTDIVDTETTQTIPPDVDSDGIPDASPEVTTTLTLAPGSATPDVGGGYVVAPDETSSGVAGKVVSATANPDGTITLVLESGALDEIFDSLDLHYSGPVDFGTTSFAASSIPAELSMSPQALITRGSPEGAAAISATAAPVLGISCLDDNDHQVDIFNPDVIKLGYTFENMWVDSDFHFTPTLSPYIRWVLHSENVASVSVQVGVGLKCHVTNLPQLKHVFPVGIVLSLSPYIDVSISGKVSFNWSQRFYRSAGFMFDGSDWSTLGNSSEDAARFSVSGSVEVDVSMGAKFEASFLERVGVYLKIGPKISAAAEPGVSPDDVCLSLTGKLEASVGAYLDIFVQHWSVASSSIDVVLAQWEKCYSLSELISTPAPTISAITPQTLPAATGGTVTLTGTGFSKAFSVAFDGEPATSFHVNSNTSMTVTTPHRIASSYEIAVLTAGGFATTQVTYTGPSPDDIIPITDNGLYNCIHRVFYGQADITRADMESLTSLSCPTGYVYPATSDISALAFAPNIRELGLGCNNISDISVLAGMTQLTDLSLSGCSVGGSNPITNISALAGLTHLKTLYMNSTLITDLSALVNKPDLDTVMIDGTPVSVLSPLDGSPKLRILTANSAALTGTLEFTDLPLLRTLDVSNNDLSGLDLSGTPQMVDLRFSDNQIASLDGLTSLDELGYITGGGNQVSDVSPLLQLDKIGAIDLSRNPVVNYGVLSGIPTLRGLNLNDTGLSGTLGLAAFTQLTDLSLARNNITDLGSLAGLSELTSIDLRGNQITDVAPLASLTKLNYAYLFANHITDLSPMSTLPHIQGVYASEQTATLPATSVGVPYTMPTVLNSAGTPANFYLPPSDGAVGTIDGSTVTWSTTGSGAVFWISNGPRNYEVFSGTFTQPVN